MIKVNRYTRAGHDGKMLDANALEGKSQEWIDDLLSRIEAGEV